MLELHRCRGVVGGGSGGSRGGGGFEVEEVAAKRGVEDEAAAEGAAAAAACLGIFEVFSAASPSEVACRCWRWALFEWMPRKSR